MALYSLYCAEVPLRNCSLIHSHCPSRNWGDGCYYKCCISVCICRSCS